jgi:hypothetical protein
MIRWRDEAERHSYERRLLQHLEHMAEAAASDLDTPPFGTTEAERCLLVVVNRQRGELARVEAERDAVCAENTYLRGRNAELCRELRQQLTSGGEDAADVPEEG